MFPTTLFVSKKRTQSCRRLRVQGVADAAVGFVVDPGLFVDVVGLPAGAAGFDAGGAGGLAVGAGVPLRVGALSCGGTGFTGGAAGTDGAALSSTRRRVTIPESTVFCWSLIVWKCIWSPSISKIMK